MTPLFFQAQNQAKIDSLKRLLLSDNDTSYVNHCLSIGSYFRSIQKDSSIAYIKKAIALSETKKLKKHLHKSLSRSGANYSKLEEYDKAIGEYERSIKLYEEENDQDGLGEEFVNIGLVYRNMTDYTKAKEYFQKSYEANRAINDNEGMAIALHNMGKVCLVEGKYPKALDYILKALPIFESKKNFWRMGTGYNEAAGVYFLQGNLAEAEKFYRKILLIEDKTDQAQNIATATFNIGLLRHRIKAYDSALVYLNKAMDSFVLLKDKQGVADCYKAIGNVYADMMKLNEATDILTKGLKEMKELGDEVGMSEIYRYLGEISCKQKKYEEAINFQKTSLELARKTGYTEIIKLTAASLSDTYKAKGDHKNALEMFELATSLKDTLLNQKGIEEIAALKADFEAQQKEREVEINKKAQEEIHQAELAEHRTLIYAFAIGGVIVLGFFVYAWRAYLQKNKANREISFQKAVIEEKNKNIIDSINYSRNIQEAILPSDNYFKKLLPESFVLYKPKDIVSGDFYFVGVPSHQKNSVVFGVADCTGHGVPGAFLTLLGKTFIQLGLTDTSVNSCAEALNFLNRGVSEILDKRSTDKRQVRDGMDIALCLLDQKNMTLGFAGAKNNAYVFRNGEVVELKADKHAIGELNDAGELALYTNKEIKVEKGDIVYLFSDGFVDQFGGAEGKKFKSKNLKEKLKEIKDIPMSAQKEAIEKIFNDWKGSNEQVDDVCLMGIRI